MFKKRDNSIRVFLSFTLCSVFLSVICTLVDYLFRFHINGLSFLFRFIAAEILLFVLYKTKWQFNGFFNGKKRQLLPEKLTRIMIIAAVLFILAAQFLSLQ
ncbi:hypothetical protein M3N64_11905 [Sporolactobacillus sp. CPB3-1]|uniref:Uncharacterized protein n=1 Tax=Sporolactobacillus mangiferae TaxID=2940498 RepID=A0ABT0MCN5_9BACL|nr:hypothetical protein [Sporolactobacillus mangiferae]MCL1632622.1 hypothetical protein [Sporolactobacillus mangiferae]